MKNALESIVLQTYNNWEIIIIDDGSTNEETKKILKEIKNQINNLRILKLPENKGIIYALNYSLNFVKTKYIARIDCDDVWKKSKLEKQVKFLEENPEYVMVATWAEVETFGNKIKNPHQAKYSGYEEIKNNLFKYNFIVHSSILIRTAILKQERYSKKYKHVEDYELWLRLADKYKIDIIPEILTEYKYSTSSISYKHAIKQKFNEIILKLSYIGRYKKKYYLLFNLYELEKIIVLRILRKIKDYCFRKNNTLNGKKITT